MPTGDEEERKGMDDPRKYEHVPGHNSSNPLRQECREEYDDELKGASAEKCVENPNKLWLRKI